MLKWSVLNRTNYLPKKIDLALNKLKKVDMPQNPTNQTIDIEIETSND